MKDYEIIKLDHQGQEVIRYTGTVIARGANCICIEARFAMTRTYDYVTLREGDLFTEWFYSDRWYNVFRVQDVDTGQLKGYYCNLTRPAQIHDSYLYAEDLALDVFVQPGGSTLLLDENEYRALNLPQAEQAAVNAALEEIYQRVANHQPPFSALA